MCISDFLSWVQGPNREHQLIFYNCANFCISIALTFISIKYFQIFCTIFFWLLTKKFKFFCTIYCMVTLTEKCRCIQFKLHTAKRLKKVRRKKKISFWILNPNWAGVIFTQKIASIKDYDSWYQPYGPQPVIVKFL